MSALPRQTRKMWEAARQDLLKRSAELFRRAHHFGRIIDRRRKPTFHDRLYVEQFRESPLIARLRKKRGTVAP